MVILPLVIDERGKVEEPEKHYESKAWLENKGQEVRGIAFPKVPQVLEIGWKWPSNQVLHSQALLFFLFSNNGLVLQNYLILLNDWCRKIKRERSQMRALASDVTLGNS